MVNVKIYIINCKNKNKHPLGRADQTLVVLLKLKTDYKLPFLSIEFYKYIRLCKRKVCKAKRMINRV